MIASELGDAIIEALETCDVFDGDCGIGSSGIASISTFRDCGVMTMNDGLVLRLTSGDAFQITIVQSDFGSDGTDDDDQEAI